MKNNVPFFEPYRRDLMLEFISAPQKASRSTYNFKSLSIQDRNIYQCE